MALIMIYETVGMSIRKVYIVLSCVVYTLIDNYFFVDYVLSIKKWYIANNTTFKETNFKLLLGIGIP